MAEIVILAVFAVILFGPEKLPELSRKAARIIAYLRRVGNDARGQLRQELGPEFDDIRLSDLNPRTFVTRHLLSEDEVREVRAELESTRDTLRSTMNETHSTAAGLAGAASPPDAAPPAAPRVVAFDPEAT